MELFEIASEMESVCAQLQTLLDLMGICEEGLTECEEILMDGDGLAKYAASRIGRQLSLVDVIRSGMDATLKDLRTGVDRAYNIHWAQEREASQKQT